MSEISLKKPDFKSIYGKSHRLSAAVFVVSNVIGQDEELKTKIKSLALRLVSLSVELKDMSFSGASKILSDLEKISLELMSVLDIAAVVGMVSQMNAKILREEFQSFVAELDSFADDTGRSVKELFAEEMDSKSDNQNKSENAATNKLLVSKITEAAAGNGHKRKDLRKMSVLEFIKGHNNVSIKDIVPNITGCSEKTIQRELISLIEEGKIIKTGERRWSKYSLA